MRIWLPSGSNSTRLAGPVVDSSALVANITPRLVSVRWMSRTSSNSGTSLADCRYYVAVETGRFTPKGEVGRFEFPPMVVAEVEVRGGLDLELRALQWLYGTWLPRSGFVPDDHPGFEAWIGRPFAHGTEYFEIRAQLPIRRPEAAGKTRVARRPSARPTPESASR